MEGHSSMGIWEPYILSSLYPVSPLRAVDDSDILAVSVQ